MNGQVTGISYEESHLCVGVYHCRPAEVVRLTGNSYTAFAYPTGGSAALTMTPAVPEPEIYALLLPGLLGLTLLRSRHQDVLRRIQSQAGVPESARSSALGGCDARCG